MGPGCFHPRNGAEWALLHVARPLQWGRDVSIPEIFELEVVVCNILMLQWGRDVSIPEITAATTRLFAWDWLQWGRDVSIPEMALSVMCRVLNAELQWGRDVSIPEIGSLDFWSCMSSPASMGPGCFHPRNASLLQREGVHEIGRA